MEKQSSFSDIEYGGKKKTTRKERFLQMMEAMIPWVKWVSIIEGVYPKGERGRPPMGAEKMLRMYLLQIWFNLSDEAMEDSLYDIQSMRQFVGINLMTEVVPDATTLLKFRHLLEERGIAKKLFDELKSELIKSGKMMREGTIVDATILDAPSSTKNERKERDPEMRQTKKGNQWYFGMKGHIGVDSESGLVHTVEATPANVHDVVMAEKLLHGQEKVVRGDSGYIGLGKRPAMETQYPDVECQIARRPGTVSRMADGQEKDMAQKEEYLKASIRAKAEHPFHIVKVTFKYRKVRYRGIAKNLARLYLLFACANLILMTRVYQRSQGAVCR
jgi:Transposase and inactivated derivatives, IS5 family